MKVQRIASLENKASYTNQYCLVHPWISLKKNKLIINYHEFPELFYDLPPIFLWAKPTQVTIIMNFLKYFSNVLPSIFLRAKPGQLTIRIRRQYTIHWGRRDLCRLSYAIKHVHCTYVEACALYVCHRIFVWICSSRPWTRLGSWLWLFFIEPAYLAGSFSNER